MDAVEVAALRALCRSTQKSIADTPEHSFEFTFSPIIPLLPKFDRYQELHWVIDRLRDDYLVQRPPCPARFRRQLHRRWRYLYPDTTHHHPMGCRLFRRTLLERLVKAFWCHVDVQALLSTAIKLDSGSLLRRLIVEAPGDSLSDGDPNTNGRANFMYKVWVKIEEDHFQEHGRWEPLGRSDATSPDSDLFFSVVHFILWKYMAGVRKQQQRGFNGYCRYCNFIIPGVICDARCPRG